MKRVLRFLRSPRVAVTLVLAVAVYSILGTLVPQGSGGTDEVAAWSASHPAAAPIVTRLGLFHAYSTPVFLVLLALLAASTAACAWSRTARAIRLYRVAGSVNNTVLGRLRNTPAIVVPVPPSVENPVERAAERLGRMGLRAKAGPKMLEASSGKVGLLGSPVFHWTLVALILLVAAGQLTRSEGMIGIPVGQSRPDVGQSYQFLMQGPLSLGQSGLTIAVVKIEPRVVVGGVERDASPQVRVSSADGVVLREQLVYPNHPVRLGSLMIHRSALGFSLPVTLSGPDGSVVATDELLFDVDKDRPVVVPAGLSLSGLPSGSQDVSFTLLPQHGPTGGLIMTPAASTRMQVSTAASGTSDINVPGEYALPGGYVLRFGAVNNYARLTVVRDWSVYGIYALLTLALVAVTIAMMLPYRVVWLLLADGPEGAEIRGATMHSARNPAFTEQVRATVAAALEAPAENE